MEKGIEKLEEGQTQILTRVMILETKLNHIEGVYSSVSSRAMNILDLSVKGLIAILISFLLYKLGINPTFLK